MVKNLSSRIGDIGSIPGRGTKSHMPWCDEACMPQLEKQQRTLVPQQRPTVAKKNFFKEAELGKKKKRNSIKIEHYLPFELVFALDYAHNNLWSSRVILQRRKLRVRRSQLCSYHHRHHHHRCRLPSPDFARFCYGLILRARYLLTGPFDR